MSAGVGRLLGPPTVDESDWIRQLLRRRPLGTIIEVGAHEGDSTLVGFAEAGWRVHAFEPDPLNRERLESKVRTRPNVTVVPAAVSDTAGTLPLYRSPDSSGISSLTPFTEAHTTAGSVEVVTLRNYLRDVDDRIAFLKVDVEGHEKFVLDGYPWESHRPDAVLLEFEDAKTADHGYTWIDLAEELVCRRYAVLVSEWRPIERYGVNHEWRQLMRYPAALADPRGWGNLIAVNLDDVPRVERIARVSVARVRLRRWAAKVARRGS